MERVVEARKTNKQETRPLTACSRAQAANITSVEYLPSDQGQREVETTNYRELILKQGLIDALFEKTLSA